MLLWSQQMDFEMVTYVAEDILNKWNVKNETNGTNNNIIN